MLIPTLTSITGPQTNGNKVTITDTNAVPPAKSYRIRVTLPYRTLEAGAP